MKILTKTIEVQSIQNKPSFHNITDDVKKIVSEAGIQNGVCIIYSHHTTCSVMIQECSHDKNYWGLEYLQQDLVNIMEKLVPTCLCEGQYLHPGPKHIQFAMEEAKEEGEWTSLNTDAHLRSIFFGRSENIVIEEGKLDLGEFGFIYFADWDKIRSRKREIKIQILGE